MIEQLSLFDISKHECPYGKGLIKPCENLEIFTDYAEGCEGCDKKKPLPMKYTYYHYVLLNEINDETQTEYIDYLSFKYWLYYKFPMFEDKEVQTDLWKIENGKKSISVRLGLTYIETNKQFVSVGFEVKGISGWSKPCDTLGEVKSALNKALEDIERG